MSATVHRLFPPTRPAARERGVEAPHPVLEALRATCGPMLLDLLRATFEGADELLFELSERAGSEPERRACFDTMRLLRLDRPRILGAFENELRASLHTAAPREAFAETIDLDRLAIQPTEALEERIAIGNLAAKAENLHKEALAELHLRIDRMIRELGIPISANAFKPDRLCEGFRVGAACVDLELRVRLLIYKLFDRFVVEQLGDVYRSALDVLDRHGMRHEPSDPVLVDRPAFHASTGDDAAPHVDAGMRRALLELADAHADLRPLDAQLAADLASAVETARRPGREGLPAAQRVSLVGQAFAEILSDAHLPDGLRAVFERLRFPLLKIGVADGSFFHHRGHPVRRLLAEAAETAASARTAGSAVARRLEERLRHIAEQIDLSAAFVRPHVAQLHALSTREIGAFLDQLREESEARRETVLGKVRRTVGQELEIHTLGRSLPAPLMTFLRGGWGPLMAARLLQHGMSSRPWIDAVNRLVQVLSSVDTDGAAPPHRARRDELERAVAADLSGIGLRPEKIEAAIGQLRRAWAEVPAVGSVLLPAAVPDASTRAVTDDFPALDRFPLGAEARSGDRRREIRLPEGSTPARPVDSIEDDLAADDELLARCLQAESWFRVFDAGIGQTQWLKVSRYYREHDSIGFNGFDASKALSVRASRFLEDLIAGRSEPVNPTPLQQQAIAALRARRARNFESNPGGASAPTEASAA